MNEPITIVIPALPSNYARAYPELVLYGTAEQLRNIANALSRLDRNDSRGICPRVEQESPDAGGILATSIMIALNNHAFITSYLDYDLYHPDILFDDKSVICAAIRAKWIDHIERSIWEQIG